MFTSAPSPTVAGNLVHLSVLLQRYQLYPCNLPAAVLHKEMAGEVNSLRTGGAEAAAARW